uniref:NADH-ubiquinone oxidoreductase chain 3 n=1 Tax=Atractomorpha echinata TaxID=52677 RepID=A0A076YFB3_9CHLO|nr:NADH dehydrogenase subunit 3 [Atractomorpha echinata]
MTEYVGVWIYLRFSTARPARIRLLSWTVAPRRKDIEKATAYECGFDPFGEARSPFEVSFYLVGILFLVFDLEVAYLFPWIRGYSEAGWYGFGTRILFLVVLTIGFVYEWMKGALDWN